jgi:hypothetical protein
VAGEFDEWVITIGGHEPLSGLPVPLPIPNPIPPHEDPALPKTLNRCCAKTHILFSNTCPWRYLSHVERTTSPLAAGAPLKKALLKVRLPANRGFELSAENFRSPEWDFLLARRLANQTQLMPNRAYLATEPLCLSSFASISVHSRLKNIFSEKQQTAEPQQLNPGTTPEHSAGTPSQRRQPCPRAIKSE